MTLTWRERQDKRKRWRRRRKTFARKRHQGIVHGVIAALWPALTGSAHNRFVALGPDGQQALAEQIAKFVAFAADPRGRR